MTGVQTCALPISGEIIEENTDMVVLAAAVVGSKEAGKLAAIFDLSKSSAGFFTEEHTKIAPVSTSCEGVFIAGCAQGPMDIAGSVAQGQAAAGLVLSRLIPGEKLAVEIKTATIDEELCSGCKNCIVLCPYQAISFDNEKKLANINEVLCRGCGVCAAACPSAAIAAKHFTDDQIIKEIQGLLR